MLISHKHKFIFIHIQKTGGSSIETALKSIDPNALEEIVPIQKNSPILKGRHRFALEIKQAVGKDIWESYFKFAIVRNPFDRLVSWQTMIKKKYANPHVQNKFWEYISANSHDFDSFIKNCTTTIIDIDNDPKSTIFNQWEYVSNKHGSLIIDYIGRFENLSQSFKEICTKIGIKKTSLPFENKTNHKHYSQYYTKELQDIIETRYKKDIQMFNYNFNSISTVNKQRDSSGNLSRFIFQIKKRSKEITRMLSTGNIKLITLTLEGLFSYYLLPRKNIIIILCPMRCGSTLLKALLGSAPDVSHLPETDYRSYWKNKYYFYANACRLSKKKIIIFKQPFWITDTSKPRIFPKLKAVKIIGLYREAYDVVLSTNKRDKEILGKHYSLKDLVKYWCNTYQNIFESIQNTPQEKIIIHYDTLISNPLELTKKLFAFIGSKQKKGIDSYEKPKTYTWKWGVDDGSEKIKELKVVKKEKAPQENEELRNIIESTQQISAIRKRYKPFA